jgi:quinol-cytochrome oxidoreductase complex cytochrome b subunit
MGGLPGPRPPGHSADDGTLLPLIPLGVQNRLLRASSDPSCWFHLLFLPFLCFYLFIIYIFLLDRKRKENTKKQKNEKYINHQKNQKRKQTTKKEIT